MTIGYLGVAGHFYEEQYGPLAAIPAAVGETCGVIPEAPVVIPKALGDGFVHGERRTPGRKARPVHVEGPLEPVEDAHFEASLFQSGGNAAQTERDDRPGLLELVRVDQQDFHLSILSATIRMARRSD